MGLINKYNKAHMVFLQTIFTTFLAFNNIFLTIMLLLGRLKVVCHISWPNVINVYEKRAFECIYYA